MSKLCWSMLTILVVPATSLLLTGQTSAAPQTPPQGSEAWARALQRLTCRCSARS